jgi:hypothetical protein
MTLLRERYQVIGEIGVGGLTCNFLFGRSYLNKVLTQRNDQ